MQFRNVPSLSRLLDTTLEVDVVDGPVTTMDYMQSLTVSIPTEDFIKLTGDEVENLYLRPMIRAIGKAINDMGNVKTTYLPIPENEIAFRCMKGKIPVLMRVVRRPDPDRHQILIHALVEPVNAT